MADLRKPVVWLLLMVAVGVTPTVHAADWYVAPGGVDGGAGTQAEPLETLAHAVSRTSSGDRILLERGGVFQAADVDVGSNLSVLAYGGGADPVLTASVEVNLPGTWAQNPEVRTGTVSERVVACYVNGRFVPLARYPNAADGFLRIDNDNEYDRIVDADLALRPGVAAGRWTGAQVRWRKWSWWWETRPIATHSATTVLDLDAAGSVGIDLSDPGSGYFIDNDLDELDAPGEWHWQGGTLYLYPPSWADPGSMIVEVVTTTSTDLLVDHENEPPGVVTNGTGFADLHFSRYYGNALRMTGPATIDGCTFSEIESVAVRYTWNSQPFVIQRSIFRDVRNVAVQGWADAAGPAGSLIERCLFLRIGSEPGYGGNGPWHAAGVIVGQANSAVVRLNRFVDTGYAGVILGSDSQTVDRNVFVRSMGTLNDGAGVYTNCNASIITDNIILDTIGDLEYSHPWWPLGHGIWLEFLEDFHDSVVTGNTIYGSNGHGIFLPNNFNCTISDNLAVDNRRAGLGLYRDSDPDQGHSISGNTLAAVAPSRRIVRPENLSPWWLPPYNEPNPVALEYDIPADFGSMSATSFVAAVTGASVIRAVPYPSGSSYELDTLTAWAADAPWADTSGSLIARSNAILLFNDTESAADMAVPAGTWTFPDGSAAPGSVAVPSFAGVVLVSSATAPTTPPYYAASGIDWRAETPVTTYLGAASIFEDGFESGTTAMWTASVP